MADEWDDDFTPAAKPIAANTKRYTANNNDEWDDSAAPQKPANNRNQGRSDNNTRKNNDDDWNDESKPTNNYSNNNKNNNNNGWSGNAKKANNDGWDDEPASSTSKSNAWNGSKGNDDWGKNENDSSNKRPFANRSNNDRGPRKPDWICTSCSKTVFGSRDECFSCHAPKGDAKDAPADGGRPKRANDWICNACSAKVFGSRTECFKCQADKGDSPDAPPDDGNSSSFRGGGGGRASDWICDSCGVKVFGSKSSCFKCFADKGDSKDAPADDGNSSSFRGGGGGRASDWICDSCGAKVFGSKTSCFKCQSDKGDSKDAPTDDGGSGARDGGGRSGARPGDWSCVCGVSNFASRTECHKCNEPKPEGAGGDPKFNNETNKEFYIPTEVEVDDLFGAGISTGINFQKFKEIPVNVTDSVRNQAPKKCTTFNECGLNNFLIENIKRSGYTTPTPIQQNAIPVIKGGRDLMACAQTGSGKTAAFLLPIINTLMEENAPVQIARPYVVIVTPTRELCTQIYNEARKFSQGSIIKCCQIYGGTASRHQNTNLNSGCHILVATPGRLRDFCDKTYVTFENIRYFVLDEADRMLDMGFAPAVEEIMKNPTMVATGKRQTLMFSATFPDDIQRLAGKYLHEYIFLAVGIVGGACQDVEQNVFEVGKFEKRTKLMELLNAEDPIGTMVFVETKRTADFLASFLSESEHPTTSIHGDRKQSQREEALDDFKKGKMKIIIATSVAARGLDIPKVRHVINYDIPKSIDDYVHRIGRTGRVGNVGKATSFFDAEQDAELVSPLVRILQEAKQKIPEFLASGGGGANSRSNDFGGTDFRNNKKHSPPGHGGGADDEEW